MKVLKLLLLSAVTTLVKCDHFFCGTSIKRPVLLHRYQAFPGIPLQKRVENLCYVMPKTSRDAGKKIKGILAYDLTHSCAQVNITKGGVGDNYVHIQMESDAGQKINYEICIYG